MSAKDTYGTTKKIEVLNGDLELDAKSETVKVMGTTNATSTSTGALVVDGGVGIAKDLHVGGSFQIGAGSGSTQILENTVETNSVVVNNVFVGDSIQATCDLDITAGCDITVTAGEDIHLISSGNATTIAPFFGVMSNSVDINVVSDFDLNSLNKIGITASNLDIDGSDIDITSTSSLDISSNNTLNIISGTIEVSAINGLDIVTGTDKEITLQVTGNSGAISFKKGSHEIISIEGSSTGNKAIFNIAAESQKGILIGNVNDTGSIRTNLGIEKEKFISALHFVRQHTDYLGNPTMSDTFVRKGIELVYDVALSYSFSCNISSFLPSRSKIISIEPYFEVAAAPLVGIVGLTFTVFIHNYDYSAPIVISNSNSTTFAASGSGAEAGERFSETFVVDSVDFKITDRQPNAINAEIYLANQTPASGEDLVFTGIKVKYDTFNPCGLGEAANYEDI